MDNNVKRFPENAATVGNGTGCTDVVGPIISPYATPARPQHNLSFVEDHEVIQAQSIIDAQFRELTKSKECPAGVTFNECAKPTRYFAVVKIFIRPEEMKTIQVEGGGTQTLYLPDTVRAEDKYQSCVGLVVSLGPQAFQDKDGNPRGSLYRVGDWVVFPRTDIIRIDFRGIALGVMTEDRAVLVVTDPTDWTQGQVTFRA